MGNQIPCRRLSGKRYPFAQVFQITPCADKNIFNFLHRIKNKLFHPLIFPDKPYIHRPFFQRLHGLISGLAGNGDLDMRIFPGKTAEIGKQYIFAQS